MSFKSNTVCNLSVFLDDWLEFASSRLDIPGVYVSIQQGEVFTYNSAFGMLDQAEGSPLSQHAPLDAASQTKVLVLIAVLQLRQLKSLQLSDSIIDYFPELKSPSSNIPTIHDLLTHQGGWTRDPEPLEAVLDLTEILTSQCNADRLRSPRYSNIGYMALAAIVSRISGLSFQEYADQHILQPLNLQDTYWLSSPGLEISPEYGFATRQGRKRVQHQPVVFEGATGLWSTTHDLCILFSVFLGSRPDILSIDDGFACTTLQWGPETFRGIRRSFGLGLETRVMSGNRWFGHTGGGKGFVSATFFCRELGTVFSVAFNARDLRGLDSLIESIPSMLGFYTPCNWNDSEALNASLCDRYHNETGFIQILQSPKGLVAIEPLSWNPFSTARILQRQSDTHYLVSEPSFEYGATRVFVDYSSAGSPLVFGGNIFYRSEA